MALTPLLNWALLGSNRLSLVMDSIVSSLVVDPFTTVLLPLAMCFKSWEFISLEEMPGSFLNFY